MADFDLSDLSFFGFPPGPVFAGSSMSGAGGGTNSPGYWKFLSKDQQCRLEKMRGARMLFNGLHREYFLDERRTQFEFPPVRIGGIYGETIRQLYETNNLLGLISSKGADLLFGDEPILRVSAPGDVAGTDASITVQEEAQRSFLRDLADRCDLAALFHQKAEDASCDGEVFLESQMIGGKVWLTDVPSEEIYPIGKPGPDRQYASYDRFSVTPMPAADPNAQPIYLLLITHYVPGGITRECWKLQNGDKAYKLALDQWPLDAGEPPLAESVSTGLDVPNITYVPNQLRHGKAANDYPHTAINLQDALNAKMSQISAILAKHSEPILSRDSRHADPDGNDRSAYKVEYNDDQTQASKYITWDAQLQWAIKDRDVTIEQLLVVTESSPVLLGLNMGGGTHATAYKSFRLMSANSIAKAARKSNYWKAGIRRALDLCCQLAQQLPGIRFDIYPINVQMRDGIPIDDLEEAQRLATLRAAGLMSLKRGVSELIIQPAIAAAEVTEIEEENQAKAPIMNFGATARPNAEDADAEVASA